MTRSKLVALASYRLIGTRRKFTFTGELAATPVGKEQAYWFIDQKRHTNHAYTESQVRPLKGKK